MAARHCCSHPYPHHLKTQWNRHRRPCQPPNSIHVKWWHWHSYVYRPRDIQHNPNSISNQQWQLKSNCNLLVHIFNSKQTKSNTGNYQTKSLKYRTMNAVAPYNHRRESITIKMKEHGIYIPELSSLIIICEHVHLPKTTKPQNKRKIKWKTKHILFRLQLCKQHQIRLHEWMWIHDHMICTK